VRLLRKLLGETDALDDAMRRGGTDVHDGEVEAPEAPMLEEEPAELPHDADEEAEPAPEPPTEAG
jgi:hypothetical protein